MTTAQLLTYIDAQIQPLVTADIIRRVLKTIVNELTVSQVTQLIPVWTSTQTFNLDGTSAGLYTKQLDDNSKERIWETKIDNNIGNQPPTTSAIEDANWREVSPSAASALQEWMPGLFGPGLIILYYNHSNPAIGRYLYILEEPVRPFNSTNIETEITAGKWKPIPAYGSTGPTTGTFDSSFDSTFS